MKTILAETRAASPIHLAESQVNKGDDDILPWKYLIAAVMPVLLHWRTHRVMLTVTVWGMC